MERFHRVHPIRRLYALTVEYRRERGRNRSPLSLAYLAARSVEKLEVLVFCLSELGVRTFETLSSLLATFRSRGLSFVDWVIDFLQGGGPKYVPPDLLPPDFDTPILLTGK